MEVGESWPTIPWRSWGSYYLHSQDIVCLKQSLKRRKSLFQGGEGGRSKFLSLGCKGSPRGDMWWDDISKVNRRCSLCLPYVPCPHGLFPVKLGYSEFISSGEGFHNIKKENKIHFCFFLGVQKRNPQKGLERILGGYEVIYSSPLTMGRLKFPALG